MRTVISTLRFEIGLLSWQDRYELYQWLASNLCEKGKRIKAEKPAKEVVQKVGAGAIALQQEKVRCGNPKCKACPHGPYWYAYYRRGDRVVSKYIGKELDHAKITQIRVATE